jgi:hypothetical protein
MDAHPTVVLNDALGAAKPALSRAADAMAAQLVEQLSDTPYFAEFSISVTGSITNPQTGEVVATVRHRLPYQIFWDRDPNKPDGTE